MCNTSLIFICAFVGYAHAEESVERLMNRAFTANLHADLEKTVAAKPPRGAAGTGGAAGPAGPAGPAGAAQAAEAAAEKRERAYAPKPQGPTLSPQQQEELETLEEDVQEEMGSKMDDLAQEDAEKIRGNYPAIVSKVKSQYTKEMKNLMSSMQEESQAAMDKIGYEVNSTKKQDVKGIVIKYMGKQALTQLINEVEKKGKEDLEKIVQEVQKAKTNVNLKQIVNDTEKQGLASLQKIVTQFKANATGVLPAADVKKLAMSINETGEYNLEELIIQVEMQGAEEKEGLEQSIAENGQEDLEEIINEVYSKGMSQLETMLKEVQPVKGQGPGKAPATAKGMSKVAVGANLMAQPSGSSVSLSATMMFGLFAGTGVTLFLLSHRRNAVSGKEPLLRMYK
eukprot:gnl/MRDRNA2_/MRDRNA2_92997_c0_seq1.p1 gnl/MRDRNA2_/MRDRNA2_92997_c0~~gnl/MRDRNA2_/MRDRNA2_92997_c0_seq1.p1  ORF type:complete len:397 (+),score=128.88 gnl/MRDRNA2_/MRDRNA2_92997_c0_seq1:104-1294(+)